MRTLRASTRLRLAAAILALFLGVGVVTAGAAQATNEVNASEKLNADQLKRLAGLPPSERDGIRDRLNQKLAEGACAPQFLGATMIGQDCDGMASRAFNSFLTTPEQSLDYKPESSQGQFCAALAQEGANRAALGVCAVSTAWKEFSPLAGVALRTAVGMQPGGQFVLGAVDTVAFIANAKDGFEKFANSTKEAGVTATNEVLMNLLRVSEFQVDDAFRDMWGIFSGIGIVILALMYFKLFKDLSDEKIDFDTVRQSLFWFGPLSILLAIFGPALAYVGNNALMGLTGAISPWTSNQIMDFATTISRFASYESTGVFGPLAAVLLFGLLFIGAWALLGLFALQPLALYLLGVGLALMIGFMIHPQYRARVAKTGSLWLGIALSKPLILLLMGALFSFISNRPAFQGEGTDDALINASSVFIAAAAMVVLAFSPALLFKFVPILPSSATSLGANRPSIAGAAMVAGAGAAMSSMIRKRRTAQNQSGPGGSNHPGGSSRSGPTSPDGGTAAAGAGVGAGGQRGSGAAARQSSAAQGSGDEPAPDTRTLGEMQRDDRSGTASGKAAQSLRGGAAAVGRGTAAVTRGSAKIAAGGATAFLLAGRESARQAAMRGRQGVNSMAPDTDHISGR
ncbi:hypothetical protein [Pseudarthrobacter raffinosi]|uniref:hypothetical protein n=1 Tax=Pseudarthrobacter raffinosi TaxID=2953651 RepID=UPI00208EEEE5|nr:hypothetical protein [Pseudarthrobacter sp. MDT3-9]MCO4252164.1 hypothetical protein [Pseudarthrobacter sp. MDT3-9]